MKRALLFLLSSLVTCHLSLAADSSAAASDLRDLTTGNKATIKLHDNTDGTFSIAVYDLAGGGGGGGGGDASAANQTAVQAVAGSDASKATAVQGITGGKAIPVTLASVPAHPVTNAGTFAVQVTSAPTTAVTLPATQFTIATASVTTDGTVASGKHHIEFVLSTDFAGTIGGVAVPAALGIYSPGEAPVGASFAALSYTISAGSAFLTTW